MKAKKLILFFVTFLVTGQIFYLPAQSISGQVMDKNSSEPLPYANVALFSYPDSVYITGTITKDNGGFALAVPKNNYLLQVSFLGYETYIKKITASELGVIYLSSKEAGLSEVVVKGKAKTFYMENGGISADIQNSRLKEMGNLSEILGQMPFVLKQDNSYTVLGKGSPVFYINNRLVRDNNELQRISSKDIKKVTVITDPGVEYDSSVGSVIKIETVKPVGEGLGITLYTYNRYNRKYSNWDRLSLNYRKSKLDIFADVEYLNMSFPKDRNIINTINTAEGITTIKWYSRQNDMLGFFTPRLGFNYQFNENTSIGARYEFVNTFNSDGDGDNFIEVFKNNIPDEKLTSRYDIETKDNRQHYLNAYLNGKLGNHTTAKVDFDIVHNKGGRNSNTFNIREDNTHEDVISFEKTNSELYAGKLTLNSSVWKGNLVYGAEVSYTLSKQDFTVRENSGIPGILPNNNEAKQNMFAGFISYGRNFGKLYADLGFRYESVNYKYYQDKKHIDEQSKKLNKIYPTFRLSYRDDDIQMQLAYRHSVNRPSYNSLRGTIFYQAPYSYAGGNPSLQPTYQNSLTYSLMWKNLTFITTYGHYKDLIVELPERYQENSILFRPVNINKNQLTLGVNYGYTLRAWRPNLELSMEKNFVKYGIPARKYNKPIYSLNFRNNIQVNGWQMGMDIWARSKGNRDIEYTMFTWNTGVYVNKAFFGEALLINIRVNDIFNTSNDDWRYNFNDLSSRYDCTMYRRNAMVQVTYRFNVGKNRYKGSRATDEKDRL